MARTRKKVLGLPIGPRQPSRVQRAARVAVPVVAAAGVAVVARRLRSDRDGSGAAGSNAAAPVTRRRPSNADPSAAARSDRAKLQRELKTGRIDLRDALERADREEAIGKTRVKILLQNLPGVGPRGATRAMEEIGIDPHRRVQGLGSNQRAQLIDRFSRSGTSGNGS